MYEQESLLTLGVTGEWIWGNDLETIVFAQASGHQKTSIFRFALAIAQRPESLPARIVNCYHELPVDSASATFPDRASMRMAIWSAIATVWPKYLPSQISWSIRHDNLFNEYVDLLLPLNQLSLQQSIDTIEFKKLVRLNPLGGRGCTTLVHKSSDPLSRFVFKGTDFRSYLDHYEDGYIREEVKIFYRSVQLVSNMPRHPNIMAPPETLVTISKSADATQYVCGSLYPFYTNGSLDGRIERGNEFGERIPLSCKAHWCYQMAVAIAHTHFVARTYHMDIKPGNFLIDVDGNLVLIDWEQSDTPVTTAAPEIDGTWDVEEVPAQGSNNTLRYTKYNGPERRNMPENTPGNNGWNVWNVFPEWSKQCPKALELAEVFSLGRCMWMVLRQPDMAAFDGITSTEEVVEDWDSSEDIPARWKQVVQDCLKHDPNERIGLHDLVNSWDNARHEIDNFEV
ncbi:MAG: hypothetical protein M1820_009600 [Bogoriella megaspora]|nr:MAG: hypothetical protein M1820_009600 [Bogoriella megaspora]